jgi:hypothetical protein
MHVSFGKDITTHFIPVPNDSEKAALYYSRRDLKAFELASKLRTESITRFYFSISAISAQSTLMRPLTSLHVSFGEIITTHLIPVPNDDDKAALYYSRRDLKAFRVAHKLRTQRKIAKIMKFIASKNVLNRIKEGRVQAMKFQKIESFYIAACSTLEVEERASCSKTKDFDVTWCRIR